MGLAWWMRCDASPLSLLLISLARSEINPATLNCLVARGYATRALRGLASALARRSPRLPFRTIAVGLKLAKQRLHAYNMRRQRVCS